MSYTSEFSAIMTRFKSEWEGRLPVKWPNVYFEPAESGPDGWIYISVLNGESLQVSMGGSTNYFRHSGVIMAQIFGDAGSGVNTLYGHADAFSNIFRNKIFSGVHTGSPSVQNVGMDEATGKYQINVSVPFYRDEKF